MGFLSEGRGVFCYFRCFGVLVFWFWGEEVLVVIKGAMVLHEI